MTYRFHFNGNGNAYATGRWNTYSDRRLKENIETIDGALDKVMKIRGVQYDITKDWYDGHNVADGKEPNEKGRFAQQGFIAQELREVLPSIVEHHESDDGGLYSVSYDGVIPVLVEAVKEQQGIINDLKAKISQLESAAEQQKAIQELMKRVEQLESSKDDWKGAPFVAE